jgi:RNA polymerase sigma-70 factor (ECF subfamily)
MSTGPSDNEIISRVLQGEQNAYAELVSRYQNFVFTLTLRLINNREDAEEVAQDVFIKAYRFLADFRGDSKFSTWLYTITHTTSISFLRKKKQQLYSLNNEKVQDAIENQNIRMDALPVEQKARVITVNKAIGMLSAEDAAVLTLFYKAEQSLEEIGNILGLDPNTVKVRLHRARRKLKEKLETFFAEEVANNY